MERDVEVRRFVPRLSAQGTLEPRMRMRVRARIAAGVVAGVVAAGGIGGVVGFGAAVRGRVAAEARSRGLEVSVRRVRPGWGRIWLRDVSVSIVGVPGARLFLSEVEVALSAGLGVRRIAGHGGKLEVLGPVERLREELASWRGSGGAAEGAGGLGYTPASVDGIEVVWREALPGSAAQRAWGLAFERTDRRQGVVRADLARLEHRGWQLEVVQPALTLAVKDGRVLLERLAAEDVKGRVEVGRRADDDRAGGNAPASSSTAFPPAGSGGELAVVGTASAPPPAAAARTTAWGPRIHRALTSLAKAGADAIPPDGVVDLAALRLEARHRDQTITVGPGRLQLGRDAKHLRVRFRPGAPDQQTPLNLTLDVPLQGGPVVADVGGGPITLAALGIDEGSFGLKGVDAADATAQGRLSLSADGLRLTFDGRASLRRLAILQAAISPRPLSGIDLGWQGRGEVTLDGSSYRVEAGEIRLGAARLEVSGHVTREDDQVRGEVAARLPLAACQDLLSSSPQGFAPLLDGVTLAGTFSLAAGARFDTRRTADTRVDWDMANDCRVAVVPTDLDPSRFARSWEREVLGADRRRMTIESGPGTPTWVAIDQISPHLVTALLICEDSRFFRHRGFDQEAIANALRDNIDHRRFFRGASTLSMQLAKNLYLGREKTLARKLEEAVLTLLLEQSLRKESLLELYLNVVEFGPGIYGIGPAAAHYFASAPARLSLGQALYLASILPNPRLQHFAADGRVTDRWLAYLHKLMHIARKMGRIDDEELVAALAEPVAFQQPSSLPVTGPEADETDLLDGRWDVNEDPRSAADQDGATPASDDR